MKNKDGEYAYLCAYVWAGGEATDVSGIVWAPDIESAVVEAERELTPAFENMLEDVMLDGELERETDVDFGIQVRDAKYTGDTCAVAQVVFEGEHADEYYMNYETTHLVVQQIAAESL